MLAGLLAAVLLAAPASACDVVAGDETTLFSGSPMDVVRVAWDRSDDVPAVVWIDGDTNGVWYARHAGPTDADWEDPVEVDKGSVFVRSEFDVGGWRMVDLAFDMAGEPHALIAGEGSEGDGDMQLWWVHHVPDVGWTEPESVFDLPDDIGGYEPFVFADFDAQGRLVVASHNYGGEYEVRVRIHEHGDWTIPETVLTDAHGAAVAVGADDRIHALTARRTLTGSENQYQAFYKASETDGTWGADNGTQITFEPEIDCIAGPVSCWPAISTDRRGVAHVAYGVDPDPCCENPPCDWDTPEDEWLDGGGPAVYMQESDTGWYEPVEVVQDIALHGSLPEVMVDPSNTRMVVAPNFGRKLAYDTAGEDWRELTWHTSSSRLLVLDSVATGEGGWLAYMLSNEVRVVHFARTVECGATEYCEPGYTRACGHCGSQQCQMDAVWGPCEDEGECYPDTVGACGDGGMAECGPNCQWGTCYGECEPGQARDCGKCGTQICGDDTAWGECLDEGECTPGAHQGCGECGTTICNVQCEWDPCLEGEECGGGGGGGGGGCDCSLAAESRAVGVAAAGLLAIGLVARRRMR